jgi:hypothetical protein
LKRNPWLYLVTGLFFCGALYGFLVRFNDPSGVNGYFYLKQILSLGQNHQFYFKDYSLAFALPAALDVVLKNEWMAFRFTVAAVMAVVITVQWLWSSRLSESGVRAASVVGVGLLLNASFYELGFGFLKNSTAIAAVLCSAFFIYRWLEDGKVPQLVSGVLFAALGFLGHKSALLLVVFMGAALVMQYRRWKVIGGFFVATAGLLAIFTFFFSQGRQYLEHVGSFLSWQPHAYKTWATHMFAQGNFIFLVLATIPIFLLVYLFQRSRLSVADRFLGDFLSLMGVVSILPLSPPGEDQFMYRFMLVSSAMVVPLMLAMILRLSRGGSTALGICMGLILAQALLGRSVSQQIPRYSQFNEDVVRLKEFMTENDHVVCHHCLEFYVDYITNIRCQIYLSDITDQNRYRFVYAPPSGMWARIRAFAEPKSLMKLGSVYLLLKEDDWQKIARELSLPPSWRNPSEHRPSFIYAP